MAMTALLDAALAYAARGMSVIPLETPTPTGCSCYKGVDCGKSAGKHPRIEWKPYQTRRASADEIRAWWTTWPDANVGIITGMISGRAVLDVDPRNGGFDTLAALDAGGAVMPADNPLAETGGLGLHHHLALDAPLPKAAPFAGIEVQADGALIVAPPSLHLSGRRYRWLRDVTAALPPLPDWVRWACEQVTQPAHTLSMPPLPNADEDDVLGGLFVAGLYLGRHRRQGLHRIRCPWAAEHSDDNPEAVVMEPGASPAPGWGFRCLHAHCAARTIGALLDVLAIPRRRAA